LAALVDREIPTALKRLSEAEDKCLKTADSFLNQCASVEDLSPILSALSQSGPVAGDLEAAGLVADLAARCSFIAETLNAESSFGDLIGQRLIKVTDFLEITQLILKEILDEFSDRGDPAKPARKPADRAARPDTEDAPDRAAGLKTAREAGENGPDEGRGKTAKAPSEKRRAFRKNELFGPDDEAMTQDEINDLIKKLGRGN
jgi:hypothetical protein